MKLAILNYLSLYALVALLVAIGCADGSVGDGPGTVDADADGDADSDSDSDSDADGDADSTGTPGDTDTGSADTGTAALNFGSDSGNSGIGDTATADTGMTTGTDTTPVDTVSVDTASVDTTPVDTVSVDTGSDTTGGGECTQATQTADCGPGAYCVGGVCCDTPCDGGCESCNLPGSEGVCTPLQKFTECRPAVGPCDVVERCDGTSGICPPDGVLLNTGFVCRESKGACDPAERCDGVHATCPDDIVQPAGTSCGDATSTECNKPDSCDNAGNCVENLVADGTFCGTTFEEFHCSTTTCGAEPQIKVTGSACQQGSCTPIANPQWQTLETCSVNQVCVSDGSTYARCDDCNTAPADSCDASLNAVHYDAFGTCDDSGGAPVCSYPSTTEQCIAPTDNCIAGVCTSFTCLPADKDATFNWETDDDEGWTLNGAWAHTSGYPFNWDDNYLQIATNGGIADPESATLVSPTMEFAACSGVTVDFVFALRDGYPACTPAAEIVLQCGFGSDWTDIWVKQEQGGAFTEKTESVTGVDAAACIREQVQFRFLLRGLCGIVNGQETVEEVSVDGFHVYVN